MEKISSFRDEYRFLSNFYQIKITYKGKTYHNVEAAFQAQKCIKEEEKVKFTLIKNPVRAKQMGKKVELRSDWNQVSPIIMKELIMIKFANEDLKAKLLATKDAYIEEGNQWHDNFWGRCICEKCKDKSSKNILGTILMEVREYYR